jgi:hypothetical protein
MRLSASAALVCCLLLGLPRVARADTIIVNGGWQSFSWDNAPGTFSSNGPFTFTSAFTTKLTVTDAFLDGDRFQVFDNNVSLGLTSLPKDDGTQVGGDADAALANSKFSSGTFQLVAGSHSISIETIGTAKGYPSGSGYLRVDGSGGTRDNPEPASLVLLVAAGLCAAGYRWRHARWRPGFVGQD